MKAQLVRPADLSADDVGRWRSFLQQMPGLPSPFLSHAYAVAAQTCFENVYVAKLLHGGQVAGFFPFQFASSIHRMLGIGQRVSGEFADYFGIIGAPDLKLTSGELLSLAGLRALQFTHLDETQTAFGLNGGAPELGLRIEFGEGGDAFWAERRKLDKKFTGDTERRERKLIQTHGPLRFTFRHDEPADELRKLIKAKRAQYIRTGVKDLMDAPDIRDFLETLSHLTDPDCRATLSTLYAGDQWVGSHFGLMCGSSLHYWFPVYNPEMRAFAPGRILVKAIIDGSDETGVRMIDRGAGDSQAKRDFATGQHQFFRGVWSRPGPVSAGYQTMLAAAWRLRAMRATVADMQT